MTLQSISDQVWLLPGAVASVVIEDGVGGAVLVDTGLDDAQARKLLRGLEAKGLRPSAVLNTHSHADHHGGNAFILAKFPELPVFAPPLEAAVINHPVLEPLALYGAMPPAELQNKFLLAPASPAQPLAAGQQTVGGVELELLNVPGHAAQMYAVRVGEVLYAADALFGAEALAKHPLTFCADSAAQKASAELLGALSGIRRVLVGHGVPTEDLVALVTTNLNAYQQTSERVHAALAQGAAGVDTVLARVAGGLSLQMAAMGPLLLNRAVVAAHLAEWLHKGAVKAEIHENELVFSLC
ncbi:MBL fold metallo-hydrolase [Deinococcus radiophilus]|uniref:MBL fold metallo-hydrolase n=1 Tax=Deinococcus radiophilus TaxID=32062 RepID=A0A3S0I5T0_9DEIO|nr:MBL fold metallo-hydrolase [Deinococcus radiophilus]RTR25462.1 MBL fold metallo-hydrolase [Deinococcus radiophilus]UFA50931.1 MBL fold metallo-hydrolase [Deinococcus radiophilus]